MRILPATRSPALARAGILFCFATCFFRRTSLRTRHFAVNASAFAARAPVNANRVRLFENVLLDTPARRRVVAMRSVFKPYRGNLSAACGAKTLIGIPLILGPRPASRLHPAHDGIDWARDIIWWGHAEKTARQDVTSID
jgi:hypothetical protein